MPFGDGTGPIGREPGQGRGMGRGGRRRRGRGIAPNAGPGGYCVCPSCGAKIPHQAGTPCGSLNCSKCGSRMMRE